MTPRIRHKESVRNQVGVVQASGAPRYSRGFIADDPNPRYSRLDRLDGLTDHPDLTVPDQDMRDLHGYQPLLVAYGVVLAVALLGAALWAVHQAFAQIGQAIQ